jgi:hypothetical protein
MLTHKTEMKFKVFVFFGLFAFVAVSFGWFLESSSVTDNAKVAAIKALQDNLGRPLKKGTLIIVDFTKPSQSKRLAAMDIETGTILFLARVAHGKNSGTVYASKLSNIIGSLQSSAGLFEITESFNGKRGPSIRLKGLDPHLNGNAEIRGIIIHSAAYVSWNSILANWKEKFRLGRSEGCFALSKTDFQELNVNLVRPAYLYAYHDDEKLR